MPEQEIEQLPDGGYRIVAAPPLPVEDWNAQISLMTGMAAAAIMLEGKVGILRTMPAPDERSLGALPAARPRALGKPWDGKCQLRRIPAHAGPHDPRQLAIMHSAGMLFRGAGYTPFDGTVPGGRHPGRHRRCLRPHHCAAAPAGRPLRPGDLRGAEQRHGRPGLGPAGAALASGDHGGLGPAGREAGAALPGHRGGGAADQPRRPGVRRRGHLRVQARPERKRQRQRRTATATGNRTARRTTATDPPASCRSPSPPSPPAAPANWNQAPRSGCGLSPRTLPPARSGWSSWVDHSAAAPARRAAAPVEDPGRVQLDWKGRYGCPVVDFLDFRIQQARPYAILRQTRWSPVPAFDSPRSASTGLLARLSVLRNGHPAGPVEQAAQPKMNKETPL